MNPFINVFTDSVDFDQVEWDGFTSLIATTDDIRLLLGALNDDASYWADEDSAYSAWALRMYAWVMAMTNNELTSLCRRHAVLSGGK